MNLAQRTCKWLACPQWYDAVTFEQGPDGPAAKLAPGWMRWNTLGLLLCPQHSYVWDAGAAPAPHSPQLDKQDPAQAAIMRCSCGWVLDTYDHTAGKVAEAYLLHLHDDTQAAKRETAVRAAFERAGTHLDGTAILDAELAEIADKAAGSHLIAARNLYTTGNPDYPGSYAALCDLLAVTAAARAALGMEPTPVATDLMAQHRKVGKHTFSLDGAAHALYQGTDWRTLTGPMDPDERDAFADAVERHSMCLDPGSPLAVDRWWATEQTPAGVPA